MDREKIEKQIETVHKDLRAIIDKWENQEIEPALISEVTISSLIAYTRSTAPCLHAFLNKIGTSIQSAADIMAEEDHENGEC